MPQVTWWRDNHLIDSSFEKTFSKTVQNTLSVPQVTREDLGATLTCQASNNNISAPASTRATVDLKCKINLVLVCHSVCLFICLLMRVNGLVGVPNSLVGTCVGRACMGMACIMAIPVVEFSRDKKLESFWLKIICSQMKLHIEF